ncbi:pentapeptide repeat-containing protein [Cryptosporangium arvum]|uniref:Putative low-complexity protein n=1 Tax=Cryptosporangium arvum DSM 44712 TaxID=927661 RepID=A0A011ALN0_9ACTN|nr:pentapeptide repeat-containing protein [Cryptosporangium arvum]EXG82831.1 putative low-complexity protein [Cryptosporangium arvum DSM 44712]
MLPCVRRWHSESARHVVERLAAGRSLDDLGLATVDGLLDLRGLPAAGLVVTGARLTGLDLSYASLPEARLTDVEWRQCRFDSVDLSAAVIVGGSLAESTVRRADLRDTSVAGSSWESVDLVGSKFAYFAAERVTFTHTTFPALASVGFTRCSFERCRFLGGLSGVRFLGRQTRDDRAPAVLRGVSFFSDNLRYAEFDGMEFDDVTFPGSDAIIVVEHGFRAVAERAGDLSMNRRDDVGEAFRKFLSLESSRPGLSATAGWAIGRRDFIDDHPNGPELADFATRTLRKAQKQLRSEGVIG